MYLTQPKAPPSTEAPSSFHKERARPHLDLAAGLGEVFEKKPDKKSRQHSIPKRLMRTLPGRLRDIIDGREPAYRDKYLHKDLKRFYERMQDSKFKAQAKNVDDLVLTYSQIAQTTLKQADLEPGITWQEKSLEHVSIFVGILIECLQNTQEATPELVAWLSSFKQPGTGANKNINKTQPANVMGPARVDDMPMVKVVQDIFGVLKPQLQKDIDEIKKECTEQVNMVLVGRRSRHWY
jgi:hypothetical protein